MDTDSQKTVKYDVKGEARQSHAMFCYACERYFLGKSFPNIYVNVYLVGRAYGGREEGGWWYNYGTTQASVPVRSYKEAEEWKRRLENDERFSNEGKRSIYSVIGDENFETYIEEHPAEDFPQERPRYE
jgi:hypothetical protein